MNGINFYLLNLICTRVSVRVTSKSQHTTAME